nr:MAG TPA: tail protein [Caudoviricetes sp.]
MINEVRIGRKDTGGIMLVIGNNPEKDYNYVLDSIDWDTPAVTLNSYSVPHMVGKFFNGASIGTRKPVISGYVVANMKDIDTTGLTWEEYYKKQLEQIETSKDRLNKEVTMNADMEIRVGDYSLYGRAALPPKYANTEEKNNEVMCYFELNFECFAPLFQLRQYVSVDMPSAGTEYTIDNTGQSIIGMEISCEFTGNVENPTFFNRTRNERLTIEKTFKAGDRIRITTDYGDEMVGIVEGSLTKCAIYLASVDSIFPKLNEGENHVQYSAASGSSNMHVVVSYYPCFYTLKEM